MRSMHAYTCVLSTDLLLYAVHVCLFVCVWEQICGHAGALCIFYPPVYVRMMRPHICIRYMTGGQAQHIILCNRKQFISPVNRLEKAIHINKKSSRGEAKQEIRLQTYWNKVKSSMLIPSSASIRVRKSLLVWVCVFVFLCEGEKACPCDRVTHKTSICLCDSTQMPITDDSYAL